MSFEKKTDPAHFSPNCTDPAHFVLLGKTVINMCDLKNIFLISSRPR